MTGVEGDVSGAASSSICSLIIFVAWKNKTSSTVLGIGLVAGIKT
jgi:hypothetical protein